VKIERIRVDAFGALSDFDTGADTLGPLVVVLGPNEAGKSTLFEFLTTALYGFHPASRERNPHVPWGAQEASGRVQLRIGAGECVSVDRRLRSSPSGTLTSGERESELRNRPLPWVEHVPRTVFGQVFAITLGDLAGLDTETWARIQDRLVGSMGSADVGSARAVADALEREASEIWRPNRRGNQHLRVLQDEIRALRGRRMEALARDREIRTLVDERGNLEVRLRETREQRQAHRIAVERIQTLLPVRRQLARIEALRSEGGPVEELRLVPSEPSQRLRALREERRRLETRAARLAEEMADPEGVIARYGPAQRDLVSRAEEVASFVAMDAQVAPDRHRVATLHGELDEIRVRLETAGEQLFEDGWDPVLAQALSSVSAPLLRDRIERLDLMRRAAAAGESQDPGRSSRAAQRMATPAGIAGGLGGVALVVWSMVFDGPAVAGVLGAALATAGAIGVWLGRVSPSPAHGTEVDAARRRRAAELEREAADMVGNLPVRPSFLSPLAEPLVTGLERLQTLVGDEAERTRSLEAARSRIASADEMARSLLAALDRDRRSGPGSGQRGPSPACAREGGPARRRARTFPPGPLRTRGADPVGRGVR
jgi:hypothetical protein